MATLKEFEDALREHGMHVALALLQNLRDRDRERRTVAPARRVTGRKMTPDLARSILDMHASTSMTQQEIAFRLGVNQGRVNEVIKHGKWLTEDPRAPEAVARDKAMDRAAGRPGRASPARKRFGSPGRVPAGKKAAGGKAPPAKDARGETPGPDAPTQLTFVDL
jgi:hypothetical protein